MLLLLGSMGDELRGLGIVVWKEGAIKSFGEWIDLVSSFGIRACQRAVW